MCPVFEEDSVSSASSSVEKSAVTDGVIHHGLFRNEWDGPWVKHNVLPAREACQFLWVCDSPPRKRTAAEWSWYHVWGSRTMEIGSKKLHSHNRIQHLRISLPFHHLSVVLGSISLASQRPFSWFLLLLCIINELLTAQFLIFQPERAVLGDNLFYFYLHCRFSFHAQFGSLAMIGVED